MTPTQITKRLDCTKSNLTQRLNTLEKNGFICRIRPLAKTDGRQVIIALTDPGKRKIAEAIQVLRRHGALLDKHFSDTEKKACHIFLKKVNHILNPHAPVASCFYQ